MTEKNPDTSPIKRRILRYASTLDMTKREFYSLVGISRGTLESRSSITEEVLSKFMSAFPEVSPAWLLSGEGPMTRREGELAVRMMDEHRRQIERVTLEMRRQRLPLVSERVAAGFGSADFAIGADDVVDYYVVPRFSSRRADFLIEVQGTSMQPRYNPGDILACRILRDRAFMEWNRCYVVGTHDRGLIVKRLMPGTRPDSLQAVSDNRDYPPFDIPYDEITGIAAVVGSISGE